MAALFISYRRASGRSHAGRLYDRLAAHFGAEAIFFDQGSIRAGERWPERISRELERAVAVLAVIDPQWPQSFSAPRETQDFVEFELRTAIRLKKTIIPLLVGGEQKMPARSKMPSSLHAILDREGVVLHDTGVEDYASAVARLITILGGLDGVIHTVEEDVVALLMRPEHPSSLWDYLADMPYMPSARDRELLLRKTAATGQAHRVRIWDYFFRPRPEDVGKSVRRELAELRVQADRTEAETTERLNTTRKRLAGFEEDWRTESAAVNAELQRIEAETGSSERRRAMKKIVIGEIVGCSGVIVTTQVVGGAGCGILGWMFVILSVILASDVVVRSARRRCTPEQIQARIAAEQQHARDRWSPRDEALRCDIYADRARVAADEEVLDRLVPPLHSRIANLETLLGKLLGQIPEPPTEAEVEEWLAADLLMLRKRGEARYAMEGRSDRFSGGKDVFVIQAPAEIQNPASIPAAYRDHPDRDKHLRARRIRQTVGGGRVEHHGAFSYDVFFIGDAVLARYSVLFDFIDGEPIRESAARQHYADFMMVEMHNEFREIRGTDSGEPLPMMLPSMILALSNGDRVTITVTTSAYFDAVDAGAAANTDAYAVANDALKAITEKVYEAKRKLEIGNR